MRVRDEVLQALQVQLATAMRGREDFERLAASSDDAERVRLVGAQSERIARLERAAIDREEGRRRGFVFDGVCE